MDDNKRTLIIDGKLIDLQKISVEELERLQKDLANKEKEIRQRIEKELENY